MNIFFQNISVLFLLFLFYIGFGNTFLSIFKLDKRMNSSLNFLCSLYLGIGFWYYSASLLGLFGHFKASIIIWIFSAIFLISFVKVIKLIINFYNEFSVQLKESVPDSFVWKSIYFITILIVMSGVFSFCLPIESDGAAFYMPLAKMVAASGWLEKLPGYEIFSTVGVFGELQLATLLVFDAEYAARMLGWLVFIPIIVLLFQFKNRLALTRESNVVQILSVFSSTCIYYISTGGKIDLFSAVVGFLGIFLLYFENNYIVAALLLAFACVAKLSLFIPFFPIVAFGILSYWYFNYNRNNLNKLIILFGLMGLVFLIVLFPHFLKNYYFYNNPLAPFYGAKLQWETNWFSEETTKRILYAYPLVWFYGGYWGQLGVLSLPILMFLPFSVKKSQFIKINLQPMSFLIIASFLGLLFWMIMRPSFIAPRYILAMLLVSVPLAALGFDSYFKKNINNLFKQRFVLFVLFLWSLHSLVKINNFGLSTMNFFNFLKNTEVCAQDGINCRVIEEINSRSLEGDRVLQLSYYTYWLRPDLIQNMKRTDEIKIEPSMSPEDIWKIIYEQNFSYLYLDLSTHRQDIIKYALDKNPSWVKIEKIAEIYNVSAYKIIYNAPLKYSKKVRTVSDGTHWKIQPVN